MRTSTKLSLVCAFTASTGFLLAAGYDAFEKQQRENEIEALLASGDICMVKRNDDRPLKSTVDVTRALSVVRLGQIVFSETIATVRLTDKNGTATHDFTFKFEGKGAICDEKSPICSTMDVLNKDDRANLTKSVCERAEGVNGAAFYDQVCTPRP